MNFFNKKIISIISIIICIIICIIIHSLNSSQEFNLPSEDSFYIANDISDSSNEISEIVVHIDGEVLNPGIVHLNSTSRISDAINSAGGITNIADVSKINLAYQLRDGQKIYIPSIYDEEITIYITNDAGENVLIPDSNQASNLININYATSSELQSLSGIGESTANKIIQYREEYGNFKSIEELMNVSGIGESKFKAIKDLICI